MKKNNNKSLIIIYHISVSNFFKINASNISSICSVSLDMHDYSANCLGFRMCISLAVLWMVVDTHISCYSSPLFMDLLANFDLVNNVFKFLNAIFSQLQCFAIIYSFIFLYYKMTHLSWNSSKLFWSIFVRRLSVCLTVCLFGCLLAVCLSVRLSLLFWLPFRFVK